MRRGANTRRRLETLQRISAALSFPVEFFYGDDIDVPDLETGSFRSMKKMTAAQRDMALCQAALGVHFSQWLDGQFDLPKPDLPNLSLAAKRRSRFYDTPERLGARGVVD